MITAIDPDLRKSGVCTLDENGEIIILKSMTMPELISHINNNLESTYVVEDVNRIKAMYSRGKYTSNTTIAQSVGKVKAAATILIELITHYTGKPPKLAPVGLGKQVKKNAVLFKEITGYKGKTNEDCRDAYMIARWAYKELK